MIHHFRLIPIYVSILIGLNKDFKKMISEHAEFGALSVKDIRSASDGTRKVNRSFLFHINCSKYSEILDFVMHG